jgi:hypothetical protein
MNTTNLAPDDETDPDLHPDERHALGVLSSIYLDAGLPLYAAVKAALADYATFDETALCLS